MCSQAPEARTASYPRSRAAPHAVDAFVRAQELRVDVLHTYTLCAEKEAGADQCWHRSTSMGVLELPAWPTS